MEPTIELHLVHSKYEILLMALSCYEQEILDSMHKTEMKIEAMTEELRKTEIELRQLQTTISTIKAQGVV